MTFNEIWKMARLQFLDNDTRTQVALKAMKYHQENPKRKIPFEEIIQKVRDENKEADSLRDEILSQYEEDENNTTKD